MLPTQNGQPFKLNPVVAHILTFIVVVIAWVPFRAVDIDSAGHILNSMFSLPGNVHSVLQSDLIELEKGLTLAALLGLIAWFMPNTLQLMYRYRPTVDSALHLKLDRLSFFFRWKPVTRWSIIIGLMMVIALLKLHTPSEFLYFQF